MAGEKKPLTHKPFQDEAKLRRYLLGMCSVKEANEVSRVLSESLPILAIIENELIEDYLTGELNEPDRYNFERRLLPSEAIVEKIEIAARLLGRENEAKKSKERMEVVKRSLLPRLRPAASSLSEVQRETDPKQILSTRQSPTFDPRYLDLLRAEDFATREYFVAYFSVLIQMKLGLRLSSESLEEVRQETFVRFFSALREGKITQPERLGAFVNSIVNSICSHVLTEHNRRASEDNSLLSEEQKNPSEKAPELVTPAFGERAKKVRDIVSKFSERDQRVISEVLLEQRDKDEVCRDLGVDRTYLRLLLRRAMQAFKTLDPKFTE